MKYLVSGSVTISIYTLVEAKSKEEAETIARDRQMCSLLDPDRFGEDYSEVWVHSGEIDGTPNVESVEER